MPTVTLDSGLRLSHAVQGAASEPALVLHPGPTDSWRSYRPVLDRMPRETYAIALSPRGHGDSDKPDGGYGVEDFAADVVQLLDALEIERAVLAGHSGSSLVARRVALDHPQRIAGLLLEASPTTLRDDEGLADFVESTVSRLEDPISADFLRSFVADTSSASIGPDLVDLLAAEVAKVPAHVWQRTFAGLLRYDDLAEFGRIRAPTLLVWGDADALVSRDMQDRLLQSIPDADLLVYPGVGHTPRWEDPARFARDLVDFVRRITRS